MLAYMGNRYPRTLPQSFYLMSYRAYLSELYTCLRTCSWSIRPNPGFFVQCTTAFLQVASQGRTCKDMLSCGHVDSSPVAHTRWRSID